MESNYKIVLASNSPRRKALLAQLDIDFTVRVPCDVDESYPATLPVADVAEYVAAKKAAACLPTMAADELVITADTVVTVDDTVLGKPAGRAEAVAMLRALSGKTHRVTTGVCLTTTQRQRRFSVSTDVTFKSLTDSEIDYYVDRYQPYDKAGAYGIQEWIGLVAVTRLNGSFFNVMGLPVQRIYTELQAF